MNPKLTATLGGLIVLAVTVAACGMGSGSSYSPAAPTPTIPVPGPTPNPGAADVVITITGMNDSSSFSPNPATVAAGQKVSWRNADSIAHTATADNGAFNTGNIGPGATSGVITMAAAGSFNYHCAIHPTMVGTLNVTQ